MVELLESATPSLRETKEAKQRAETADACKNETNLSTKVGLVRVDQERDTKSQGDGANLVEG